MADAQDQETKPQEDETKSKAEEDFSKLKSSYDQKLAASGKEITGLKEQIEQLQSQVGDFRSREDEINARAEAAKYAEDPEKAIPQLEEAHRELSKLRKQLSDAEAKVTVYGDKGLDYAARYKVASILLGEKVSDVDKLVGRLQTAQSESELDTLAERLVEDLRNLGELRATLAKSPGDEKVDTGGPSAAAQSLIDEMRSTPPEEWPKKEAEFKRKAGLHT